MGSLKRRAQVIPKNLYKVYSILFHKVVWAVMGIVDIASPISGIVYFVFFFFNPTGSGCGGPGWEAKNDHGVPDSYNSSVVGSWGAGRIGH